MRVDLTEDKKRQISNHLSDTLFRDRPNNGKSDEENKENNSTLDLSSITEEQLLNIFSDKNVL